MEYIRDLLSDDLDSLYEELGELRGKGLAEDAPDVEECKRNLRHVINALRDVQSGMIELAGVDGL